MVFSIGHHHCPDRPADSPSAIAPAHCRPSRTPFSYRRDQCRMAADHRRDKFKGRAARQWLDLQHGLAELPCATGLLRGGAGPVRRRGDGLAVGDAARACRYPARCGNAPAAWSRRGPAGAVPTARAALSHTHPGGLKGARLGSSSSSLCSASAEALFVLDAAGTDCQAGYRQGNRDGCRCRKSSSCESCRMASRVDVVYLGHCADITGDTVDYLRCSLPNRVNRCPT